MRVQVLARDGYKCRMCGRGPPEVRLHVDHVIALADGGTDEIANYATLCDQDNNGKGAFRFRDYRDIHVPPPAIPLDHASLFAYANAHPRPASMVQRVAAKRGLETRAFRGDATWLMELLERLDIPTVRDFDDIVTRNVKLAEAMTDYLQPEGPIDSGFVLQPVLEIEAIERGGASGLAALHSNRRFGECGPGGQQSIMHAYQQLALAV